MKDEAFARAKELEQEMKILNELTSRISEKSTHITVEYFNNWDAIKDTFNKTSWEDILKTVIQSSIINRKLEIEEEFKKL